MIHFALTIAAAGFLIYIGIEAVTVLVLMLAALWELLVIIPRRGWQILGILAAALGLLLLYAISPAALAGLAGLAVMVGLAVLVCLGLDRLWARLAQWIGDSPPSVEDELRQTERPTERPKIR